MQPEQDQNYWQPVTEVTPEPADITNTPVSSQPQPSSVAPDTAAPLTWEASEFVHHEKNGLWFLALLAVAVILLVIDIFLIHSWTFGILIVVMTIAVGVMARRPPRTLTYSLSLQGIRIDDKLFSFHDFRSFGLQQEDAFYSIRLIPNKRFMPAVSVFFPPEYGEQIVDVFGSMLPMEPIEPDSIDKIVEKIRF